MTFHETRVRGVFAIALELHADDRGSFARTFCRREFEAHGIDPRAVQCNVSFNRRRGTLRGMHYQLAPHAEGKLVRCGRGAMFDVAVDLRPQSPTFREWVGVELRSDAGARAAMLYLPPGCAHGFQTLADDTEVVYQMSEYYEPSAQRGFRWDDPAFAIAWPEPIRVISERDRSYPDFVLPAAAVES
jgi:dTDP-4-dehydrorhamnose 3,5-epimerase